MEVETSQLMTVKEFSIALHVSESAVRTWIYSGILPVCRMKAAVRLRRSDLNKIIEGGLEAVLPREKKERK